MTGRVLVCTILLALACAPAYGISYGSTITMYGDAIQSQSWTEVDYYDWYFGYEARVEAYLQRDATTLDWGSSGDQGFGYANVALIGYAQPGDAMYQVYGYHYRLEPIFEDYWAYSLLGYSNASVWYDDPYDPLPVPEIDHVNPDHGVANVSNYIEIYGYNFIASGTTTVTLGGQALTVGYLGDNQINVQYPAQTAGEKTLVVTTANGSGSATFTIGAGDPTPVVSSINPGGWPAGQTTNFSVSGTGFGTAPTMTIQCGGGQCQGIGSYGISQGSAWDRGFEGYVNVSSNAPTQDVTLVVESHGSFGQAFAPQNPPNPQQGQGTAQTLGAPPPTLVITSNGSQISSGQTVFIETTPQMPNIQVYLNASPGVLANGVATYQLVITHTVTYTQNGQVVTHTDTDTFPNGPPSQVPAGSNWSPGISYFVGGDATLTWTYNSGPAQTFTFKIRGQNPSEQAIRDMLNSSGYWFAWPIIKGGEFLGALVRQFNTDGTPVFGPPNGWGVMQVDPPSNVQQKWNWQMNIQEGLVRIQQKVDAGYTFWRNQAIQWHNWNTEHPGDLRLAPDDVSEANCAFTLSPLSQSPWTQPTAGGGTYWYGDAIAIKRYNGASAPPGTGEPGDYLTWRNGGNFVTNPYWHFQFLNAGSGNIPPFNYVNRVCSQ